MTDDLLTPDELLALEAKADTTPPARDPLASYLPDEVPDGEIRDEDDPDVQEHAIVHPQED